MEGCTYCTGEVSLLDDGLIDFVASPRLAAEILPSILKNYFLVI
jgi:hypothetical protein